MSDFKIESGQVWVTEKYLLKMMREERRASFFVGFLMATICAAAVMLTHA